jgi:very-short-patch-repair endonuclease
MDPRRWWTQVHDIDEFASNCSPDDAIAAIASRQGGVVDRLQLSAGLGRGAIDNRILAGRLRSLHHGVYAVGHEALQLRGLLVAGLLVAGPGAALSHRTAAALWRLLPSMPPFVEITTTNRRRRDRRGLVFHRTSVLDATLRHDLPVTTPIRTLLDLAATRPRAEVERACSEALVLALVSPEQLDRQHGRGSATLRRIVGDGIAPTRSELERRFLRALSEARLPRPEVNRRVGGHRVDFHWPGSRLVVELDGWRFHGHRLAFERDRARDVELQLAGWTVIRFTWRQLRDDPAARVAPFLSRPALRRAS